ncbi:hypothetical protein P389DRAFT_212451 [Cystobasidium minutum MCA 4210]|uniref:uncharacterized protein n=1 Tax=Cystobasidium minutum MCA 4210 TaxID=1397322 RepID=UPI0034CDEB82|eukprot:jgi/Rhomi1/212451/estExt_Genemark1.C_60372
MPFASMTDEDVHAFYQLLDEYFESRKEMFASWGNASPAPAAHRPTAASSGGRMLAPAAPPVQSAHRPTTPSTPSAPSPPPPPSGNAPSRSSAPMNKYGITVPSMNDLRDPRFQSAFKFAGSSVAAAGGLLNKHLAGGGQHNNSSNASNYDAAPAAAPPPKNPKPVPFSRSGSAPRASAAAPPPPPPPMHAVASNRGVGTCTASFDYNSGEPGDLSFREGDRITILVKESADWWKGALNGREGLFPASYVAED